MSMQERPSFLTTAVSWLSKVDTRFVPKLLLILVLTFSFSIALPNIASDGGVVVAQDGDDGGSSEDDKPKKKNALQWLFEALGIGYIAVFLILSFILVALFVMNILSARRDNICPSHLIDGFEANLDEKKYQEAYEMAKADESFLGNVLSAGLAKLSAGYGQAIEAMQEVGEEENMKLQHRLSYLALIGTISPMIGLFGTVHGMIVSFITSPLAEELRIRTFQHPFKDGVEPSCTDVLCGLVDLEGKGSKFLNGIFRKIQFDTLGVQQCLILFRQRILWLRQDPNKVVFGQRIQFDADWKSSLEFRHQFTRLIFMKRSSRNKQNVIRANVSVFRLYGRALDNWE